LVKDGTANKTALAALPKAPAGTITSLGGADHGGREPRIAGLGLGHRRVTSATLPADPGRPSRGADRVTRSPPRRGRPFGIYTLLFLVVPAAAVVIEAFRSPSGHWTWANTPPPPTGLYLHGFVMSIELSCSTSIVPGVLGLVVANAVLTSRGRILRRIVSTASGVFASRRVPLAFLFIRHARDHRFGDRTG